MSASIGSGSGGGRGSQHQDFELNLASIIDCFTVLIAFLLVSTAFVSIGIFDAGVAAAGATQTTPPPIQIQIGLTESFDMELKVTGKMSTTVKIPAVDKNPDYVTLGRHLNGIKTQWKEAEAVTLASDSKVKYRTVVKTMEEIRKSIPVVLLGGF